MVVVVEEMPEFVPAAVVVVAPDCAVVVEPVLPAVGVLDPV